MKKTKTQKCISKKMKTLKKEGRTNKKQNIAIALKTCGVKKK